jgi:hypothetical protein
MLYNGQLVLNAPSVPVPIYAVQQSTTSSTWIIYKHYDRFQCSLAGDPRRARVEVAV